MASLRPHGIETQEQLAVWHGREVWDVAGCGGVASSYGKVFLYPVEYNTFASGHLAVSTKPRPGAPAGMKQFRIPDHLGSVRVELDTLGVGTGIDYEPFGALAATTPFGGQPPRVGYIDKERDLENGLGDFGVRKYDPVLGRFLSVDALWERYRGLTPYTYCGNDPVAAKDPTGLWIKFTGSDPAESERLFLIALEYLERHDTRAGMELRAVYEDKSFDDPSKGFSLYTYSEGAIRPANSFDADLNEISWNPFDALVYVDGSGHTQRLSPAVNLGHEWGHKNLFERDKSQNITDDKEARHKREKEVINAYEGNAAIKTGEIRNERQIRRSNKSGSLDRVSRPDSNR